MFSMTICPDEHLRSKFTRLLSQVQSVKERLAQRLEVEPENFVKILKHCEETHHLPDYSPTSSQDALWPGTYYLTNVDDKFRRTYARKPKYLKSVGSSCGFL